MHAPARYALDRSRSRVGFAIRLVAWKVRGGFADFEGTVGYDPSRPEATTADGMVRVASIDTKNRKRDEHLRTPDFFDAATYPTMRFAGRRASALGDGALRLEGDLTIRDVTRPAAFETRDLSAGRDDSGRETVRFTATSRVDRMDYAVGGRILIDKGALVVGREVFITLQVHAVREG